VDLLDQVEVDCPRVGRGGDFPEDFQCPLAAVLDFVGGDERIVVKLR
jgi:hypothetical protein